MTCDKYEELVAEVTSKLDGLSDACNEAECQKADWAGCVLRAAGHDFMDFNKATGVGGADACIDFADDDNKGLAECLREGEFGVSLSDVYSRHCIEVSEADFLVIAAEAVMKRTRARALAEVAHSTVPLDFKKQFRFGRATAHGDACLPQAGVLPNPEKSCGDVERVFIENMGLSWRQSAALMGVHSLGRAKPAVSGYDGYWSDPMNQRRFNNDYYVSMLAKGWVPEKQVVGPTGPNPNKNQWARDDIGKADPVHQIMLNSDMCLAFKQGGQHLQT